MTVYFIQAVIGGPVKIGHGEDVSQRLATFQIGCPFELKTLATMPGGKPEERELHFRFDSLRQHGEWFAVSEELRALIEGLGGQLAEETMMAARAVEPQPRTRGDRIRALRKALCLSQLELSGRAGLDRFEACKLERGKLKANSYRAVAALAKGFGMEVKEFASFMDGKVDLKTAVSLARGQQRPAVEA